MHANVFVAVPGTWAADIHGLITLVLLRVVAAFGVHLEPELRCIGFGAGEHR
jgi:UDP-N-acetylenolpyruvoylglucosamine reductase